MLDLTYFATGYWQHVFTKTEKPDERWVYKMPAAFGYVMPFARPGTVFSPRNAFERALKFLLEIVANALCKRVRRRADRRRARNQRAGIWALMMPFADAARDRSEKVLLAYCRSMRQRKFRGMLRVMEYLRGYGRSEILFPYTIVRRAEAILRVNGAVVAYRGPLLIQRMADCVFENGESVRSFDWSEVAVGQERLWRVGVGLSAWREILGPWGLLDGHARLFDTSGLTRTLRGVQGAADEERLERMQRGVLEQWAEGDRRRAAKEYFEFIRERVTRLRIVELWETDLKRSAGGDRGRSTAEETIRSG